MSPLARFLQLVPITHRACSSPILDMPNGVLSTDNKKRDFPLMESLSSLVIVISFFRHSSLFTIHYSLSIECKVSFEGTVVIWLVKA